MKWVLGYAGALCVLLLIISQSVLSTTFFMPFFNWHYQRNGTHASIGITESDLNYVTTELLAYMRGKRQSLDGITVAVAGNNGQGVRQLGENFFSAKEIRHMYDVRDLYVLVYKARAVAFFLLAALVLAMLLLEQSPLYLLSRCSREVVAGFFGVCVVFAVFICLNFERAWDIFHHVFFRGEAGQFYQLTPFRDLMINLFPLDFFMGIAAFVAARVVAFSAVVVACGSAYLHLSKDRRV